MTPLSILASPPAEVRPAPSEPTRGPSEDAAGFAAASAGPPLPLAPQSRYGISTRVALGGSYQRLYTVNITSGELELAFGGRVGNQLGLLFFDLELGRTEFGLHTQGYHAGALTEWSAGRFRYGLSARLGALVIRRATDHDDSLGSASVGLRAHVAWDLIRSEDGHALFAELALRGDFYVPLAYGPSVMIGYRWESNRRLGGSR